MKKEQIRKHANILLGGLLHALKGAASLLTLALGVVACCCVAMERGYLAVGLFVAGLLISAGGLLLIYNCGRDMTGGKFSK